MKPVRNASRIIAEASSNRSRKSSMVPRKAANSRRARPRPSPSLTPAVAQQIEHRHLLCHAQRVVPWQDDRGGAEIGVRAQRRQIRQELRIVRAERVVEEVVFHRPDDVEAELIGEPSQTDFLLPGLAVAHARPAIGGENHLNADVHAVSPDRILARSILTEWTIFPGEGRAMARHPLPTSPTPSGARCGTIVRACQFRLPRWSPAARQIKASADRLNEQNSPMHLGVYGKVSTAAREGEHGGVFALLSPLPRVVTTIPGDARWLTSCPRGRQWSSTW